MKNWYDLYMQQMGKFRTVDAFYNDKIHYKNTFFKKILKNAEKNGKILEAGCGSGTSTIYLSKNVRFSIGIDADMDMIALARQLNNKLGGKAEFRRANIKTIPYSKKYFDVVFSNGVLEHFTDKEIVKNINEQLRVARTVLFAIPSIQFAGRPLYGDERFLSVQKWKSLIQKTNGTIISTFGFHYRPTIKQRLLSLIKKDYFQFIGFEIR